MYKDGLVSPEGNICIPMEISNEKAIALAQEMNPDYDNLNKLKLLLMQLIHLIKRFQYLTLRDIP